MIGLWDTTGNEVVKALAAERRSAGGVASGLALTLVVVVDEKRVREAEAAATIAAAAHPCRLLVVVRSDVERDRNRLDAEIVVGGRLGPCEAVVMRMYGRLALHAESVVMPLLAPDVPVVTWWHGEPPEEIAYDSLGVVADRRITDAAQAADPVAALRQRAEDYAPGDTDLAWTRITPWRTLVAGRVRHHPAPGSPRRPWWRRPAGPDGGADARLAGQPGSASTRRREHDRRVPADARGAVALRQRRRADADPRRQHGGVPAHRPGRPARCRWSAGRSATSWPRSCAGSTPTRCTRRRWARRPGCTGLEQRPPQRVHIWKDPATAQRAEAGVTAHAGTSGEG